MRVHVMHTPGFNAERDANVQWYRENWPGEVCVHPDPDRNGILWNHRQIVRCMAASTPNEEAIFSKWELVVQDDALPVPGVLEDEVLKPALMFAPASFVSLSHFSSRGEQVFARGQAYSVGLRAIWGQAVAYRRTVLERYLAFVEEVYAHGAEKYRKWDDGLMSVFNVLHGTQSCFTSVALFQHEDTPSVMGHVPGVWRHAGLEYRPGLSIPWMSKNVARQGSTLKPIQRALLEDIIEWRKSA